MKKGVFIVIAIALIAAVIFLIRMIRKNNATESTASTAELSDTTTTNPNNFIGKIADLFNIKLPSFNTGSGSTSGNTDTGTSGTIPPKDIGSGSPDTGSGTNTDTGTGSGSSTITGPTEPLPLRYKGGQILYQKFNGELPPVGGYAFLANGTVIYSNGITYDVNVSEYVDVQGGNATSPYNASGVNTNMYLGYFMVSGTWTAVYGENKFTNLSDYPNAVGFLVDGAIVYFEIRDEGTPEETTFYYV